MYQIGITEENVTSKVEILKDELPTYTKQTFRMFGGESEKVTLQFDRSILGQIYDQFGEETTVKALSDNILETKVQVQVSPAFWGWVFQFGNKISIKEPNILNDEKLRLINEIESSI